MKDTGGAAFPFVYDDKNHRHIHCGMTLRDYFAAKALQVTCEDFMPDDAATLAYEIADAMLAARDRA